MIRHNRENSQGTTEKLTEKQCSGTRLSDLGSVSERGFRENSDLMHRDLKKIPGFQFPKICYQGNIHRETNLLEQVYSK